MQMTSDPVRVEPDAKVVGRFTDAKHLVKEHSKHMFQLAPHALSMVIVAAHASHITEVFNHISLGQLVLAAALFAVWYFSKSGSEIET